jgi:hypothetical protein
MTTIELESPKDWDKLMKAGLTTVIDPMIYRSAEVFLLGSKNMQSPEQTWEGLSSNIDSLISFFDLLVFHEKLPMFDYDTTFPLELHEGKKRLREMCGDALVEVKVGGGVYGPTKQKALDTLIGVQIDSKNRLAQAIHTEMSSFDYEWRPDLGDLGDEIGADDQVQALTRFILGGLVFGAYAEQLKGQHVLQPKRARLHMAMSFLDKPASTSDDHLFSQLKQIAEEDASEIDYLYEIPPAPTVLPYLLSKQDPDPVKLFERLLKLRQEGAVKDYRKWRDKTLQEIKSGLRPIDAMQKVHELTTAIRKELIPAEMEVEGSIEMGGSAAGVVPKAKIGVKLKPRLLGWCLRQFPGNRYEKLLMRILRGHQRLRDINTAIEHIW